jgi:hypothetical protein
MPLPSSQIPESKNETEAITTWCWKVWHIGGPEL